MNTILQATHKLVGIQKKRFSILNSTVCEDYDETAILYPRYEKALEIFLRCCGGLRALDVF